MKRPTRVLPLNILTVVSLTALLAASCGGAEGGDDVALPVKGIAFQDPEHGATLLRITDKAADGYLGPGIENEYARADPENGDGTQVILRGNDGEWYLYALSTLEMIRHLSFVRGGGEEPEPRWDPIDPDLFTFFDGPLLKSYRVSTDTSTVIHDFTDALSHPTSFITTKTEGDASPDRRTWCLMLEDDQYRVLAVVVYDRTSDAILGTKTDFKDGINWVSMDMSGAHCVIGYEDSDDDGDQLTPPADVFSRDMTLVTSLPEGSNGHMDLAISPAGRDVMVYQNNATDWIEMADLTTGQATRLVQIPFDVNPDIGLHVSGNCAATPGWALISTYNSYNPPPGSAHSWMDSLLFLVELKTSPTIRKLARTNAYTSKNFTGDKNYFAEAFAAINRAGTRVYFGSNWGSYRTDYSDAYLVTIP